MKSKLRIAFMMCALVVGLSVTAAAQTTYRTRNGRAVTVYQNNRRVVRRPNGRRVVVLPNGRRIVRNNGWQRYQQPRRAARTYRTRDGRLVTILPNGRRVYRY